MRLPPVGLLNGAVSVSGWTILTRSKGICSSSAAIWAIVVRVPARSTAPVTMTADPSSPMFTWAIEVPTPPPHNPHATPRPRNQPGLDEAAFGDAHTGWFSMASKVSRNPIRGYGTSEGLRSPSRTAFFSRNATGDIPNLLASMSSALSTAKAPCGPFGARYAPVLGRLVRTSYPS